jgi:hypothetical protein
MRLFDEKLAEIEEGAEREEEEQGEDAEGE